MFFNAQNPMFPFQKPNMNGQMPFPFQMPNMNGQMPFQFPFPNPFQMSANKFAAQTAPAEGAEGQAAQQPFNPFAFFQQMPQMPQMQQFMDMFKNMFAQFGMNPQNCGCQQGFNPFAGFRMPDTSAQMQQFADMLKNMFAQFGMKGDKQDSGLPFGMPVKLLQILLHMDSTPDGLSKLQKILDMIFDEYSRPHTHTAE